MKNLLAKKIMAIGIITFSLMFFWMGSIIPFKKGMLFIRASSSVWLENATYNQVGRAYFNLLNYHSPVGQTESAVDLANAAEIIITNSKELPKEVAKEFIRMTDYYLGNEITLSAGNYGKNLFSYAKLYFTAGIRFQDEDWLKKSESLYLYGIKLSPNRPEFLRGLFDIYLTKKDKEKAIEVGKIILKNWPDEKIVEQKMLEL